MEISAVVPLYALDKSSRDGLMNDSRVCLGVPPGTVNVEQAIQEETSHHRWRSFDRVGSGRRYMSGKEMMNRSLGRPSSSAIRGESALRQVMSVTASRLVLFV